MPLIRVSEESYRVLKEMAKVQRRSLASMIEVLLIPAAGESPVTVVLPVASMAEPLTDVDKVFTSVNRAATHPRPHQKASPGSVDAYFACSCPGKGKGQHLKSCGVGLRESG